MLHNFISHYGHVRKKSDVGILWRQKWAWDLFAERRRRWSDTYKGVPDSDEEDEVDGKEKKNDVDKIEDTKLKVKGLAYLCMFSVFVVELTHSEQEL